MSLMPPTSQDCDPGPPPRWLPRQIARVYATYVVLRWVALLASLAGVFIVVTSLVGSRVESTWVRITIGLAAGLLLPWLLRGRLRQLLARRFSPRFRPGGTWFFVVVNGLTLSLLCFGFCDETGRALRRRGDWFLGQTEGWLPRRYRAGVGRLGRLLERFDLPEEARTVLADAALPQPRPAPPVPPPPPDLEGPPPPPPRAAVWFHPLSSPRRVMPPNAACRFGAPRPGRRPPECELGHCGVDLFLPTGTPIHAVHDGKVKKIERDEKRGGISGLFVILSHKQGAVETTYVHLDSIPAELRVGQKVAGGRTIIGTVGATGCRHAPAHLHLNLAIRTGARARYIDPEPLLWLWQLPQRQDETRPAAVARAVHSARGGGPPLQRGTRAGNID